MVTTTVMMEGPGLPLGPGKTAPRLINDLLDHDPRYPLKDGRNILRDPAPIFRGKKLAQKHHMSCRHSLMKKELRTKVPASNTERPTSSTQYVIHACCHSCRYHFEISVEFWKAGNAQCPCSLSDEANPLHHFRLVESANAEDLRRELGDNKYLNAVEAYRFECSGARCPTQVTIKISPPRLSRAHLHLITDPKLVHERSRREILKDPQRFQDQMPLEIIQVLAYLRQYLVDAKSGTGEPVRKRIAKRNKKYIISFSDECESIFEYLDFQTLEEEGQDVNGEVEQNYFWQLPLITEANKNFIDDVLLELNIQIFARPQHERQILTSLPVFKPLPALPDIQRSFGCWDYPTRSRTVDLSLDEHPYYASLGAVDNFTDDLLGWSYERQCECDPSSRPYYLDCLQDLAKGRESSDLQMKVAMAISQGEHGLKAIEEAYKFFGLDFNTPEGDEYIMGLYKSRIVSAPRQKEEAKNCLLIIAKHRVSHKIEALANETTMTVEEALKLFNVTADTASDSIDAAAVAAALDEDKAKVVQALEILAKARDNDMVLHRAAERIKSGSGGSTLEVGDAYARLQISERQAPDETIFYYYQSLLDQAGSASGSKESYAEALRVIAIDRGSNFLLRKLEDPNADVLGSSAEPVGLENIGNTCYLNSLLQYYYTVKPVRNMVIDFQTHRMSLEEDEIKKKRVGGRIITKSEVIKAQKFVDELHDLFENLKTASSRSVKPTKELAELTIFSSAAEANFRRHSISSPGPPPLSSILDFGRPVYGPQWPPPSTVTQDSPNEDDIEMVDNPIDKDMDIGDDSSDSTLVNDNDTSMTTVSSEKTEKTEVKDEEMADGEFQTSKETNNFPPPETADEKPPPIPPRNKANLSIQTNESRDLITDDELWRFGSQQDVTEVIGNVMFRLQCAIKPTSIEDGSGVQIDIIRDSFYGANTVYNKKGQVLEKKVEVWSNIIVFPGKSVAGDIYEALDVVYDQIVVEIDKASVPQYTSISILPPILQIQIQRTEYDSQLQRASKNRTPVIFPETIYLDRYVDSADPDSVVMRRRRETWKWKAELRKLEAREAALKNAEAEINVPDALNATKEYINALQEEEIDGVIINPALPEALEERLSEIASELEKISGQITTYKRNLAEQFTDMREYEYKLHAVFIHRGETGGGHYWVYIYDFEHDIWREYNDEHVTDVKDRRRIFDHQGAQSGTPYYLVYVRSSDRDKLVNAVCRDVQEVQMPNIQESWASHIEEGMTNGVDVDDEMEGTRHVEHAKPRPLRPKPAHSDSASGGWDHVEGSWGAATAASNLDANGDPW